MITALVFATVFGRAGGDSRLMVPAVVVALDYYALGRRRAVSGWAPADLLLLAPLPGIALDPHTPMPGDPLAVDVLSVWVFFFVLPYLAGRVVGSRARVIAELRANLARIEQQQRERAGQAASAERTRIALELHDVVAHSVSLMVIQSAAARRVAGRDRDAALEALRAVEDCGRDALRDLRRVIGVLYRDGGALPAPAAPGLWDLDGLVERARRSGLQVEVTVVGTRRPLPAQLDLAAFRIIQEALTNVIKHAGDAHAVIWITFSAGTLELLITDDGMGSAGSPATPGSGQGLIGMRERTVVYGGDLTAGRTAPGGFEVRARIPVPGPAAETVPP